MPPSPLPVEKTHPSVGGALWRVRTAIDPYNPVLLEILKVLADRKYVL